MNTEKALFYESPSVRVVEIAAEGIVCHSGGTESFTTGTSYGESDFD